MNESEAAPNAEFDIDEFEAELVEEFPELAEAICFLDEMVEEREKMETVSKKQQKRDRIARLTEMMTEGRSLYETASTSATSTTSLKGKHIWLNVLEKMENFQNGPFSLLARAVKEQKRVEIRTRAVNRIDRIFVGVPMTFDFHLNVALRNTRETVLLGRQEKQDIGYRNRLQSQLPPFLRWNDGGEWPLPIGKNRIIQYRDHRACFVKGDSVVLIRLLQ